MAHYIDAMGKACPQPVILARQALGQGQAPLTIAVDNPISVENLKRLAGSRGIAATVAEENGRYEVTFPQAGDPQAGSPQRGDVRAMEEAFACAPPSRGYAVFISKDRLGEGDPVLGANLIKMFLYTLSQSEHAPASLLFMNGGVRLPAGEEQDIIASIRALAEKGCEVLVCGACLNYYGLAEKLQAGQVSNMYDILSKMQGADKVISI